jgi:hypothetical protein
MQSCCFGFEQHRGRWAVFSAAFHHAERAPRVISSLTAESPTIRSFKTSLVSIQVFSPPVSCAQGRLGNGSFRKGAYLVFQRSQHAGRAGHRVMAWPAWAKWSLTNPAHTKEPRYGRQYQPLIPPYLSGLAHSMV